MEAAHDSAIKSPEIMRFYGKHKAKHHVLAGKNTVANNLTTAIDHMLKHRESFDATSAFG
jgi:hypothetical protein